MLCTDKKLQSAIEAVLLIAAKGGSQPVNSRTLCTLQGEKERYLEPLMQSLVHGHILRSIRGPKGGYVLARERRKITLGSIASIISSQESKNPLDMPHSVLREKIILPLWKKLDAQLIAKLEEVTLEDLCKQGEPYMDFITPEKEDFII